VSFGIVSPPLRTISHVTVDVTVDVDDHAVHAHIVLGIHRRDASSSTTTVASVTTKIGNCTRELRETFAARHAGQP